MKRPLEEQPPINPELKNTLMAMAFPTWYERLSLQLYMAARHAFKIPLPVTCFNTPDPYMVFDSLDEIMTLLDLNKITQHLTRDNILRYPLTAPDIDPTRHFAQWAVVWEPVVNDLCAVRTLKVDVGAGFCLLSLTFTPLQNVSERAGKKMQLDKIILQYGHDAYDVLVGRENGVYNSVTAHHVMQLFTAARTTIALIHDDYPLAETTLTSTTQPIFEQLRARVQEYLHAEAAEEAQNGGNTGFPRLQEP